MTKRKRSQKVDWNNITVIITEQGEPNPQNPYAMLTSKERNLHLKELCQEIYLRILYKKKG